MSPLRRSENAEAYLAKTAACGDGESMAWAVWETNYPENWLHWIVPRVCRNWQALAGELRYGQLDLRECIPEDAVRRWGGRFVLARALERPGRAQIAATCLKRQREVQSDRNRAVLILLLQNHRYKE